MTKPILTLLILGLLTTGTAGAQTAPLPTTDWPRSEPAEQGLDGKLLLELADLIRQDEAYPNLHSLLVVRHGYLVFEQYFDGWTADRLHPLWSVTKSFTSALIGIAIEQGMIRGVDEKVLGFFPEMKDLANVDDRKRAMTLEDLLTMRSGTDYHENGPGSPHFALIDLARGWDRFYLERPMLHLPGTEFQYDSGGVILMSAILKQRTGLHADGFAARYLFPPLGIERTEWLRNEEGHPQAAGGLELTPRDRVSLLPRPAGGAAWTLPNRPLTVNRSRRTSPGE